jgi:transcription elongation regulator 1
MMPNFPPPLPAGWSEHTAPDGVTKYYYNSHTKDSTYTRPSFAPLPFQNSYGANGSGGMIPVSAAAGGAAAPKEKEKEKKKKEKPKEKVQIPGTTWTRVTTTEGNIFYFEKESKQSEWTVPEEIRAEVEELEKEEREMKEAEEAERQKKLEEERLEKLRERERIRLEVEEERKRKLQERERKRKERSEGEGPSTSTVGGGEDGEMDGREAKMSKKNGDDDEAGEEEEKFAPEDPEDEAEWMRAVAAEFAEQDAQMLADKEKDEADNEKAEEEAAKKVFAVPDKVSVSLEEGRALFKVSPLWSELACGT